MLPVSLPSPASFEDIIPGDGGDSGMRGRSFPSITHLDSSSSGAGSAESVNDDNIDDDDDDYDREVSSSSSAIYDTDDI